MLKKNAGKVKELIGEWSIVVSEGNRESDLSLLSKCMCLLCIFDVLVLQVWPPSTIDKNQNLNYFGTGTANLRKKTSLICSFSAPFMFCGLYLRVNMFRVLPFFLRVYVCMRAIFCEINGRDRHWFMQWSNAKIFWIVLVGMIPVHCHLMFEIMHLCDAMLTTTCLHNVQIVEMTLLLFLITTTFCHGEWPSCTY